MIKLYGIAISNYYNMAKLGMLEKNIAFEEVAAPPSQEAAYKSKSPVGKIPCIETEHGFLSETGAIVEYLEETHPSPRLYPAAPYPRAKVRELMRICELYIELSARRHFGHVFFGAPRSESAVEEARPVIEKGLAALKQLGHWNPYVAGADFTWADIYLYCTFGYAGMAVKKIYNWDIVAEVPGLQATLNQIAARPTTRQVDAAQQMALQAFMAQKSA